MLSFVPTPIGNLGDITIRSLERLSSSEIVFCEDTRVSKHLFKLFEERYPQFFTQKDRNFISLHHHNQEKVLAKIDISIFQQNIVYVSDAGTPAISDPGIELINFAIENNVKFDVLPGATALTVASLLSGFADRKLLFWGFLPHKGKDRENELNSTLASGFTTVIYESPHRILKLLDELSTLEPKREILVAKELTKKFEKRYRGLADEVANKIRSENLKGEWIVVLKGIEKRGVSAISKYDIENLKLPPKEKAKLISKITGETVKDIYNSLINN